MSETRYCVYCRRHRDVEGGKWLMEPSFKTKRWQCFGCKTTRSKPRAMLQKLADQERAARQAAASARGKEAYQQRMKGTRDEGSDSQ